MNRPLLLCAILVLASSSTFSQSAPTEQELDKARQSQAAAQQQLNDQKAEADGLKSQQALSDFLDAQNRYRKLEPGERAELDARFLEFRMAIPRFREATKEYGQNLGMTSRLDKDLKNIESQTVIFLRYFSAAKVNHPRVDAQEFKDFSPTELQWETLKSAEYIASLLDNAVALERNEIVSLNAQKFMYMLDGQLLRLKWLTTHTK